MAVCRCAAIVTAYNVFTLFDREYCFFWTPGASQIFRTTRIYMSHTPILYSHRYHLYHNETANNNNHLTISSPNIIIFPIYIYIYMYNSYICIYYTDSPGELWKLFTFKLSTNTLYTLRSNRTAIIRFVIRIYT
jgi:hypothetical protein